MKPALLLSQIFLFFALLVLGYSAEAQTPHPCRELGGTKYSCIPAQDTWRVNVGSSISGYFTDLNSALLNAASVARSIYPSFSVCDRGILTDEIEVAQGDKTSLKGIGNWIGYTNTDPRKGENYGPQTITLWGDSIDDNGKKTWYKCRTSMVVKQLLCPKISSSIAGGQYNGKTIYMCIVPEQQKNFIRTNIPEPATSWDVNTEGQLSSCNPVTLCASSNQRKIVRAIDYQSKDKFPIIWGRTYNHKVGEWHFDYHREVTNYSNNGVVAYANIKRAEGSTIKFTSNTFEQGLPINWVPNMGGKLSVLSKFSPLFYLNGNLMGFQLENQQGETEIYNAEGQLIRIENYQGNGINFSYDGEKRLKKIISDENRYLEIHYLNLRITDSFSWNGGNNNIENSEYEYYDNQQKILLNSLPSYITDGTNSFSYEFSNVYSNYFVIKTFTDLNGNVTTYNYGETDPNYSSATAAPYELTGIIDSDGNRYASYYYTGNNIRTTSHGDVGDTLRFSGNLVYNPKGKYTTVKTTSSVQNNTDYNYGKAAGLTVPSPFVAGHQASEFAYDPYGNPTYIKSFTGNIERRTYDGPRGLPLTVTQAADTPIAHTQTFTWRSDVPLPLTISEPVLSGNTSAVKTTTFNYDNKNRVDEIITSVSDGSPNRIQSFAYDAKGNVILSVDELGIETSYTYDNQSNLLTQTVGANTPLSQTQTFGGYNPQGSVGWSEDEQGLKTHYVYDASQKVIELKQSISGSSVLRTWKFDYDGANLLRFVTNPDGTKKELIYDTAHRFTEAKQWNSQQNLMGRTVYTLNSSNEIIGIQQFDGQGNLETTQTATYDDYSKLDQLKGALSQTTNVDYDLDGRLIKKVNPLMGTTTYTYDALNRLTKEKNPLNGETLFAYGPQDELLTATDAKGLSTRYTYNGFGDLVELESPDRGLWRMTYDAVGLLTTTTDPRGVVATMSYDALSRPIQKTFSDAGVTATQGFKAGNVTQTFTYDSCLNGKGRLCSIVDNSGTTSYQYNAWGEKTKKSWQGVGNTADVQLQVQYGYEAQTGRLISTTFPSGKIQQFVYGSDGRIQSTSYNNDFVATDVQWTSTGMIKEWTWAQALGWSGIHSKVQFTYDLDGRPNQIKDLDERSLVWDNGNRLVGVGDTQNSGSNQTYGYDALNRLTQADVGIWNGSINFGYDSNSNRTSMTDNASGGAWTYTYGIYNHRFLSQQATGGSALTSTYDDMGNLIADGIGLELKYDATGRLVEGAKGLSQMKSTYNALGERVSKTSMGLTNEIVIYTKDEAGRPLGTYVVDTNAVNGYRVKEEYLHLNDWRPIAVVRPNSNSNIGMNQPQIYPILTDHLGTPRKVLDGSTGETRWSWDSKQPFGYELPNETPTANLAPFTFDLRFAGQMYDAETGLFHNGFRDYHPGLGRYVQSDPIGLEGGWNTYGYVGGNPLSGIDPLGLIQKNSYQKLPNRPLIHKFNFRNLERTTLEQGTMLTDKGTPFLVLKIISGNRNLNDYAQNCHGFAIGADIWVEDPRPIYKDEYHVVNNEKDADIIYWSQGGIPVHSSKVTNDISKNLGYSGALGILGISGINQGKNGQLPIFLDPNLLHIINKKTNLKRNKDE